MFILGGLSLSICSQIQKCANLGQLGSAKLSQMTKLTGNKLGLNWARIGQVVQLSSTGLTNHNHQAAAEL